jgi:hypothetical protein
MDVWANKIPKEEMAEWVMEKAVKICWWEFSFLTDQACCISRPFQEGHQLSPHPIKQEFSVAPQRIQAQ